MSVIPIMFVCFGIDNYKSLFIGQCIEICKGVHGFCLTASAVKGNHKRPLSAFIVGCWKMNNI